jgi:hypothetical protein
MFEKCFALSQNIAIELRLFCLERLGDLSMKMNDIQTTTAVDRDIPWPGSGMQGQVSDNASIPMPWPDFFRQR